MMRDKAVFNSAGRAKVKAARRQNVRRLIAAKYA